MRRGFTLIELLVVIAIIGILSAVVLASLSTARLTAKDAQIKENMHALRTALQSYYITNGSMPANINPGSGDCTGGSLAPLVTAGLISKITGVCYYDYGSGNAIGGLLVAQLQGESSATGPIGTCRPWAPGANWCSQSVNSYYCLCNPY
jgi:prepilin-type N-terminal cleavage/methylation domain-containing protein